MDEPAAGSFAGSAPDLGEVAGLWAEAIAETSFVVITRSALVARLRRRLDQLQAALRSGGEAEAFDAGRRIGSGLVESHFTDAEAVAGTLSVLVSQLAGYAQSIGATPRLAAVLGGVAAGYADTTRQRTLAEQQRIHQAVITARDEAQRQRWDSQARFEAVFTESAIGIGIGGLDGKIIDVNQALCDMLGYTRDQLESMGTADFAHPADDPAVWSRLSDLVRGDRDHFRTHKAYYRSDGREIWTDLVVTLIRDQHGAPRFAVGMVQDITERVHLVAQLRHQATHDPLTSLANRTVLFDRLTTALSDPDRDGHVGICFLDLDGFKAINDTLGHDAGDELLGVIAARLADALDGPGRLIARMGGDEFVLLVDNPGGLDDLIALAKAAQSAVSVPIDLDGHRLNITASIGVVCQPTSGMSAAELMKAADTTLYWAKNDGRGRVAVFDRQRHLQAVQRYRLAADMPHALTDGQFHLEYQPIVRLDDGAVTGVEALLRWRHPQLGRLGPHQFIDIAENTGVIVELGRWVLHRACLQAETWHHTNPAWQPLLSVNLSPRQLAEPAIVDDINGFLDYAGIEPGCLQLELTESALMSATGPPLSSLRRLADAGVRIALDDFGTGYSNLAYLTRLPIHTLKLAGPFVTALNGTGAPGDADTEILHILIQLAHTLGLTVIAENVETRTQADVLTKLGCDYAQGWLYGRACAASDITQLVNSGM